MLYIKIGIFHQSLHENSEDLTKIIHYSLISCHVVYFSE